MKDLTPVAQNITAEFNLNVLRRINRELCANFDVDAFSHCAIYNEHAGGVDMHLVTEQQQTVIIDEFTELPERAVYLSGKVWTVERDLFSVHCLCYRGNAA